MLNAEKFKDKIMYSCDGEFGFTDGIVKCAYDKCDNCIFSNRNNQNKHGPCSSRRVRWLLSEYKEHIKVTRLEYELLKFIDNEGYKYIARDNCGGVLFRYPKKPTKNIYGEWGKGGICSDLRMFNDLFQFVQFEDEEPRAIKDILESCEVVNDAKE